MGYLDIRHFPQTPNKMDPTQQLPHNWVRLVRRPLSQRESESTWKQMDDALAKVRAWLQSSAASTAGAADGQQQQIVRQQLRLDWPQLVLPCVRAYP